MNPKEKIFAKQLKVLQTRLDQGKPLTSQQMAFVQQQLGQTEPIDDVGGDEICSSANALAKRLGVARQLVAYHLKLSDSPKELRVSDWYTYFRNNGKIDIAAKGRIKPSFDHLEMIGGLLAETFARTVNGLPETVMDVLRDCDIKLPPEQADKLTLILWARLAARCQLFADEIGLPNSGPVRIADECEIVFPPELSAVQQRVSEAKSEETLVNTTKKLS